MKNTIPQVYNKTTLLKEYYMRTYKTDELGKYLNNNKTFVDLFECLDNYQDVYDLIGIYDSLIRERLFSELAKIMCVDYNYIYDQWIRSSN